MNPVTVSYAPHIHNHASTSHIMRDVLIALSPALAGSVLIFGMRAAVVIFMCVASAVVFEWGYQKIMKKQETISDLSACVTGLLLAFNLPVDIPLWQAVFGSGVAIILVKQFFGGIGKNFANPALTARVVMLISFPTAMSTWAEVPNAVSSATPLELVQTGALQYMPSNLDLFLGLHGGSLGETSELALIIGGVYLIARRVITWHIPVSFIGTVYILTAILGEQPTVQLLAGGLFIGAIFMATDYPTSPQTNSGRLIFGLGCGLLTVIIRVWGNYPEGVSFAILFMNCIVPFINKLTMHHALGGKKA
ncbi:MAG: RnfABCDGE type electron transport complex subunit D [Oscillospiraceae bacterium]|nr:RnfABCDGE type electron transport complex subunit D [Oscillospiraceae bacterium]